jgi:signal transduction histidine kinase
MAISLRRRERFGKISLAVWASCLIALAGCLLITQKVYAGETFPQPPQNTTMSGYGIPTDPLVITNCGQFAEINSGIFPGGGEINYVLGNDIDCSAIIDFQPIILNYSTLDGRGHTISNITNTETLQDYPGEINHGAFIKETNGSSILNLKLRNISYTLDGEIDQVSAGGLIGKATNTIIDNVSFEGSISVPCSGYYFNYIGGLIGNLREGSSITNSYSDGEITIRDSNNCGSYLPASGIGGLVGRVATSSFIQTNIEDTYSNMNISLTGTSTEDCSVSYNCRAIGGLIGALQKGEFDLFSFKRSYAAGSISITFDGSPYLSYSLGGLIGYSNSPNSTISFEDSFSTTSISTTSCGGSCNPLPRYIGAAVGMNGLDSQPPDLSSFYYDAGALGIGDSDVCIGSETNNDCNAKNTVNVPDANYFKNNSVNAPVGAFSDFDSVWELTVGLPILRSHPHPAPNPDQLIFSGLETVSISAFKFFGSLPSDFGLPGSIRGSNSVYVSYKKVGDTNWISAGSPNDHPNNFDYANDGSLTISGLEPSSDYIISGVVKNNYGYYSEPLEIQARTGTPGLHLISTCLDLQNIRDNTADNYELAKDIDCSDTINWNNGSGFEPIDNGCFENDLSKDSSFSGVFAGNNHTISDLYIGSDSNRLLYGLFVCTNGAIVQDFTLLRPVYEQTATPFAYAGGIAGALTDSEVINVHIENANFLGPWAIMGGIAGVSFASSKDNTFSKTSVTGVIESTTPQIPGDAPFGTGGLIGSTQGNGSNITAIDNSYSNVTYFAPVEGYIYGGLVGSTEGNTTIDTSYANGVGEVIGTSSNPDDYLVSGGLFASFSSQDQNTISVHNSFSTIIPPDSSVVPFWYVGGVLGFPANDPSEFINTYFDADRMGTTSCDAILFFTPCTPITSQPNYFFNNTTNAPLNTWDFTNVWKTTSTLPVFGIKTLTTISSIPAERLQPKVTPSTPGRGADAPEPTIAGPIKEASRFFGGGGVANTVEPPKSLIENIAEKVRELIRNIPEPIVRSFPFILISLTGIGIGFMVLETRRQAHKLSLLQSLIAKQRSIAQQRDTFWHLAANYLRAPITLLMGGVEILEFTAPKARSLGAAVATNASIPSLQSATIDKITKIVKAMQAKVAAIMDDIEGSKSLKDIAWPAEVPVKILRTLGFWIPMTFIVGLMFLVNYIIVGFRQLDVSTITYLTQALLFGIVAYALYWGLGGLRNTQRKVKTAESLLTKQTKSLKEARSKLIFRTTEALDTDVDKLQKAMDGLPADSAAVRPLQEGSTRLRSMVDSFQILNAAESGNLSVLSPVGSTSSIDTVLKQIIAKEQLHLGPKGIVLDAPDKTNFTVPGTPKLTEQVIGTVLNNAIAFSPDGGKVTLDPLTKGPMQGIRIQDHGNGVSTEQLEHMFEPFTKADGDDALRMNHEGLGIDLYLNKLILEHLGGSIAVDSTPGKGTTVTMLWPKTVGV